jgi:hypothetical protein
MKSWSPSKSFPFPFQPPPRLRFKRSFFALRLPRRVRESSACFKRAARAAALDERMPRTLETLRESECGRYALELYRGLGARSLIPNASSANCGKIFLPTDRWRREFARDEDARTLKRDGILRTVEKMKRKGELVDADVPATGAFGRHDTERLRRLLSSPQKVGGARREGTRGVAEEGRDDVASRSVGGAWRGSARRSMEIEIARANAKAEEREGKGNGRRKSVTKLAAKKDADGVFFHELCARGGWFAGSSDRGSRGAVKAASKASSSAVKDAESARAQG